MRAGKIFGAGLFALTLAITANAQQQSRYAGGLLHFAGADDLRDADYGGGWNLLLGYPIGEEGDTSLELNAFGTIFNHETDRFRDYHYGLGVDARFMLGTDVSRGFFLIGGGGATLEEVRQVRNTYGYVNLGLGYLLPLTPQLKLRAEARSYGIFNEDISSQRDLIADARGGLGFEYSFGAPAPQPAPAPEPTPEPAPQPPPAPPAFIPPPDADGDGIIDAQDRCPGTPPGLIVDQVGCPLPVTALDNDGDGVVDLYDQCPGTPIGVSVDTRGCPLPQDADSDGVPNALDKCPGTPAGLRVGADGCVIQQVAAFDSITFETGSGRLTAQAKQILDGIARGLAGQPTMTVEIGGHTDSIGDQAANLALSKERAASVKTYLIGKRINPRRLTTEGYGEFKPVADNNTEAGRAKNRRVEFRVISK